MLWTRKRSPRGRDPDTLKVGKKGGALRIGAGDMLSIPLEPKEEGELANIET
jgi:hypothetical protein